MILNAIYEIEDATIFAGNTSKKYSHLLAYSRYSPETNTRSYSYSCYSSKIYSHITLVRSDSGRTPEKKNGKEPDSGKNPEKNGRKTDIGLFFVIFLVFFVRFTSVLRPFLKKNRLTSENKKVTSGQNRTQKNAKTDVNRT